jgi:hypothetical protein
MHMRRLALVGGVLGVLLGGLWMLQGLGLVHLRPILCFANCEPVQGPSTLWTVVGAIVLIAGIFAIRSSRAGRGRR